MALDCGLLGCPPLPQLPQEPPPRVAVANAAGGAALEGPGCPPARVSLYPPRRLVAGGDPSQKPARKRKKIDGSCIIYIYVYIYIYPKVSAIRSFSRGGTSRLRSSVKSNGLWPVECPRGDGMQTAALADCERLRTNRRQA